MSLGGMTQPSTSLTSVPPPAALYPGLNQQALGMLGGLGTASGNTLTSIASGGGQQAFQQMAQALQQNFQLQQKQGLATIKEQFGAAGLSNSSPAAVGTGNYLASSSADFMNTLANLQLQSQQQSLQASEFGASSFLSSAMQTYPTKVLSTGASPLQQGTDAASIMAQLAMLTMFGV